MIASKARRERFFSVRHNCRDTGAAGGDFDPAGDIAQTGIFSRCIGSVADALSRGFGQRVAQDFVGSDATAYRQQFHGPSLYRQSVPGPAGEELAE